WSMALFTPCRTRRRMTVLTIMLARRPISISVLLVLEHLALTDQGFLVFLRWRLATGQRPAVEQTGRPQLLRAGQVARAFGPELVEEGLGDHDCHRPACPHAAAAAADRVQCQQLVDGAAADGGAPDLLDLGPRRELVIGDDRQRLD